MGRQVVNGIAFQHLGPRDSQGSNFRQGRRPTIHHQTPGSTFLVRQTPKGQPAEFPSPQNEI
jgi:hypothetical protein